MSKVSRQSSAAELQLPAIPPLERKDNFMQWKNLVIQTFQFHGMLNYLKLDSTKIDKDAKTKAFGIILIMSSISPVVRYVEDAGWDFGKEDQDPKDLYDLIKRLYKWRLPFEQDLQSPVAQFRS
jgi:hypothetical protein